MFPICTLTPSPLSPQGVLHSILCTRLLLRIRGAYHSLIHGTQSLGEIFSTTLPSVKFRQNPNLGSGSGGVPSSDGVGGAHSRSRVIVTTRRTSSRGQSLGMDVEQGVVDDHGIEINVGPVERGMVIIERK